MRQSWFPFLLGLLFLVAIIQQGNTLGRQMTENNSSPEPVATGNSGTLWHGTNHLQIPFGTAQGNLAWYGYELIANTSFYLGPKGTAGQISNAMNCQNCHLGAGTLPFANNFGKVYATYPQFRSRSNKVQSIYGRINDCLERSMNGKLLDTASLEIRAMYAYIQWLGQDVPKGNNPAGTGVPKLEYINRAASPDEGKKVYVATCQSCHGANGQGQPNVGGTGYIYPPLWGAGSYNDGAGLYRLSSFAGFVKYNMPFGADYNKPQLTTEEAWDVAAFVNSQPRPHKDQSMDWKNIRLKPADVPFGPYPDSFSTQQHKYGPYKPIIEAAKRRGN